MDPRANLWLFFFSGEFPPHSSGATRRKGRDVLPDTDAQRTQNILPGGIS